MMYGYREPSFLTVKLKYSVIFVILNLPLPLT